MKLATSIAERYLMKRQDDLPAHHIEDFLCTGSKSSVFPQCSATSMTAKENKEAKEHNFFFIVLGSRFECIVRSSLQSLYIDNVIEGD